MPKVLPKRGRHLNPEAHFFKCTTAAATAIPSLLFRAGAEPNRSQDSASQLLKKNSNAI
jgi:hypothetical protein